MTSKLDQRRGRGPPGGGEPCLPAGSGDGPLARL